MLFRTHNKHINRNVSSWKNFCALLQLYPNPHQTKRSKPEPRPLNVLPTTANEVKNNQNAACYKCYLCVCVLCFLRAESTNMKPDLSRAGNKHPVGGNRMKLQGRNIRGKHMIYSYHRSILPQAAQSCYPLRVCLSSIAADQRCCHIAFPIKEKNERELKLDSLEAFREEAATFSNCFHLVSFKIKNL